MTLFWHMALAKCCMNHGAVVPYKLLSTLCSVVDYYKIYRYMNAFRDTLSQALLHILCKILVDVFK